MAVGWVLGLFAGAVIPIWLYNKARDSILIVAVWHACFNFVTASTVDTGVLPALLRVIVIVWAVLVIIRTRPEHFMYL